MGCTGVIVASYELNFYLNNFDFSDLSNLPEKHPKMLAFQTAIRKVLQRQIQQVQQQIIEAENTLAER